MWEDGGIRQANAALRGAACGNVAEARQRAAEALKIAFASQGVEVEAARGGGLQRASAVEWRLKARRKSSRFHAIRNCHIISPG